MLPWSACATLGTPTRVGSKRPPTSIWSCTRTRFSASSVRAGVASPPCFGWGPGWPRRGEPFSAVDEPTRIGIHEDVLAIVRELHIATILVTHDLAEAITVADRVALLSFRPARVVRTYDTGFGRDRDVRSLRVLDTYSQLYAKVWEGLNEQSQTGRAQRRPVGG